MGTERTAEHIVPCYELSHRTLERSASLKFMRCKFLGHVTQVVNTLVISVSEDASRSVELFSSTKRRGAEDKKSDDVI